MPGYALLSEPWWVPVIFVLIVGHITNICVTLYLHRSATHGGVEFHPLVEHLMRAWLWLTTGMKTKEWVAVHRKHHAYADREGDPHSPTEEGFWAIVLFGVFFYRAAATDKETVEKYGRGTPDDWMERNVYTPHPFLGLLFMMMVEVYLFGLGIGLLVWSFGAIWMPIMGNIINGIGHALGYRNFGTKDDSHNIYPFGIWIVGEELHNNHHADPRSAKFNAHWWELDIGWVYIKLLAFMRLADVVYARTLSAKEFAGKYYEDAVAEPVSAKIGQASARLEQLKAEAIHEIDELRSKVGQMRTDARRELDEARAKLEQKTSGARHEMEEALARARSAIEFAKSSMDSGPRPEIKGV